MLPCCCPRLFSRKKEATQNSTPPFHQKRLSLIRGLQHNAPYAQGLPPSCRPKNTPATSHKGFMLSAIFVPPDEHSPHSSSFLQRRQRKKPLYLSATFAQSPPESLAPVSLNSPEPPSVASQKSHNPPEAHSQTWPSVFPKTTGI